MSTFFGLIDANTSLRRFLSPGSNTKSAPSRIKVARLSALRDKATTVRFIDLPRSTDATPTPPDAPVTSKTDPSPGEAGGSLHCVRACQAVRKTRGAAAISSKDQPTGTGVTLSAGTTTFSARVPQLSTPTLQRRMPTVSPTRTFLTPGPTANTSPTPSRPSTCGSGGLAGYMPRAKKASAGFNAANLTRSNTSAGPGCGCATSPSRSVSRPSYASINHARMTILSQLCLRYLYLIR